MFKDIKFSQGQGGESSMPIISFPEGDEDMFLDDIQDHLPLLALKNTVLYPGLVIPITVGRDRSLEAIKKAEGLDKFVAVISQRDVDIEKPNEQELYEIGTVAKIIKVLKMPDGNTTAILQGRSKFRLKELTKSDPYLEAHIEELPKDEATDDMEFEATIESVKDLAKRIIELSPQIPTEAVMMVQNIKSPTFLLNFIASNLNVDVKEKQRILEHTDLNVKAEEILQQMGTQLQMLELKDQIESKVRGGIEQQQKEYFLNQQLKTIQEELGQNPQEDTFRKLEERAAKKNWPEKAKEKFESELNKARRLNPQIGEYSVTLNYLELLLDLPWDKASKDNFNLKSVRQKLDEDHYGLDKVKERILEHLAVLKLKGDMKAPIICLVGPPGVGKTSLGKSIADALNRKFVRMSLGGVHDESEIRGHRKTYIGAMPGRILQSLKKAESGNPVFILDEIDKLGKDFRGDPSSALLEVLDPEQNENFYDNYLELEYDLSKILFIATANSLNSIQPALLDRMEIIRLGGYSVEEKVEIAKKHLVPKQIKNHGLKKSDVKLSKKVLESIIQKYTREAGVRSLDRTIGSVMRHVAKKVAMEEAYNVQVKVSELNDILGPAKVNPDKYNVVEVPGVAVGLAYTAVGGDILFIEATTMPGKGKLQLTGNLGDVMKESASTAYSFIKSHSLELNIDDKAFEELDIHIHVPEGAVPKDGPSAGVTMLTALTSKLTGRKVKSHLAMTGEITLRGKVLPVGGIKEKILAAKRAGVKEIILCEENRKHVEEINQAYLKGLTFHYVDAMSEVLDLALEK